MANTLTSYVARNVGTSATTVYTVGAGVTSTLIGLLVSNVHATLTINVTITLTRGANVYNIVKGAMVPVGGSLAAIGVEGKIVALAGDIIKVTSDQATSADVILSCLEQS